MTEYTTRRIATPPVLAIEDGQLVIKLIDGDTTLVAGVGDGRWFFSQVVDKLVNPALTAVRQMHDAHALSSYPGSSMMKPWNPEFIAPLNRAMWRNVPGVWPTQSDLPVDEDGDRIFASPND